MNVNIREQVVDCIRQYGTANSDAVLDPHCQLFSLPHIHGLIGYRMESDCAIVYGDPICSLQDRTELVTAFHRFCGDQSKQVVYLVASEEFKEWSEGKTCEASIEFGGELYLDPTDDPRKGPKGALTRRKVRHAVKEGVAAQEYQDYDEEMENAMMELSKRWLENRSGPQVFISHITLFENRKGKRWFYATQGDKIIGVVAISRLRSKDGWLLNRLMIDPDAPGGTPELLVITAIDQLAKEGCHYVTFGGVPGKEIGEVGGFGQVGQWLIPKIYTFTCRFFHLGGRQTFWKKFQPQSQKRYVLFGRAALGYSELMGLIRALNVSL